MGKKICRDYIKTPYGFSRSRSQSVKINQLSQPKEINQTSVLDTTEARGLLSDHPVALQKIYNDPLRSKNKVSRVINQIATKKGRKPELSILDISAMRVNSKVSELRSSDTAKQLPYSFSIFKSY